MVERLAIGGAAVIALATLLFPTHSSAKGFLGAPMHRAGAFHFHLSQHGQGSHFSRRGHSHQNDAYGGGYGYWPLGVDYGNDAPAPEVLPLAYPIYVGHRCVHSVETVIVPAELGGERAIRITRCQ